MKGVTRCRSDFPLLKRMVNGHPLIYLDNAATSLKPQEVIDAMVNYYQQYGANIYRGIYTIAEEATTHYEESRCQVAEFIGAYPDEIIFTKGATEAINLVACSWVNDNVCPGDRIIVTAMEHHANFVPWQQVALRAGARFDVVPVLADGTLDMHALEKALHKGVKLVSVCHVSNVSGACNDIAKIVEIAHEFGAYVLIDAAQSVAHQRVDVRDIACDFLAFSGHKVFGPTGIGVLYVRREIMGSMKPYHFGGGMVSHVHIQESGWAEGPQRFEAGTPPIASAIGLAQALRYIRRHIDFDELKKHESFLCKLFIDGLLRIKGARIIGPVDQLQEMGHIVSFTIEGFHPHDIASYCDCFGICVRAGLHCAQPLAEQLDCGATVRVSLSAYNTESEIKFLLEILEKMVGEMEGLVCKK